MYYTLMMLDRQLEITKATAEILKKNAETMEAMKNAAMYNINSTGVEQSKAAYAQVLASIPDIEQRIRETENALSTLLGEAPHGCIGSTSASDRTFGWCTHPVIIQSSGRKSS